MWRDFLSLAYLSSVFPLTSSVSHTTPATYLPPLSWYKLDLQRIQVSHCGKMSVVNIFVMKHNTL